MVRGMGARMRDELRTLLTQLETELQAQHRWESEPPDAAALRSRQPFAVDTLSFDQWLQWLFLPRMHELLMRQLPLPSDCAIGPMAEEVYRAADAVGSDRIIAIVSQIDSLLGTGSARSN